MAKVNPILEAGRPLGEEFVLWLWKQSVQAGGVSEIEGDSTALFMDETIQFSSPCGDVQEVLLKKGNPAESLAAFEAIARGMRPVKATMRLLQGDLEWKFTLVAATLEVQGAKLPSVQSKGLYDVLSERFLLLEELNEHIQERFEVFAQLRFDDADAMRDEFHGWIMGACQKAEYAEA